MTLSYSASPYTAAWEQPTVFDTPEWIDAWSGTTAEQLLAAETLRMDGEREPALVPLYLIRDSPFWNGYEADARVDRVWTEPLVVVPTLYAVYGPAYLRAPASIRSVITTGLERASHWRAAGLLVANLPWAAAARWAHVRPPTGQICLDIAYRCDVDGDAVGALQRAGGHRRREWRRRWRRARESGVHLVEAAGPRSAMALSQVLELANQSAVKHDIAPLYDQTTFARVASLPSARLFYAELDSRILAGILTLEHDHSLYLWAGGIDYSALADFSPYLFLFYELITMAPDRGWHRLEFGRGTYAFKQRYGFAGTPLWSLFYASDPEAAPCYSARLSVMHERLDDFMKSGS